MQDSLKLFSLRKDTVTKVHLSVIEEKDNHMKRKVAFDIARPVREVMCYHISATNAINCM